MMEPIDVCSLDRAELDERIAWIRQELLPHVEGRVRLEGGVALELRDGPGIEAKLDHWIELERACCGGLSWERTAATGAGRLRVEIGGANPDGATFGRIPLLAGEEPRPHPSRRGRILRASGIERASSSRISSTMPGKGRTYWSCTRRLCSI